MKNKISFLAVAVGLSLACWMMVPKRDSAVALGAAAVPTLILYSGPDFSGESLVVTGTLIDLAGDDKKGSKWNDEIRSIRVVSGTWRLYQHGRLGTKLDDTSAAAFDARDKELDRGWSCLVSGTSGGAVEFPSSEFGDWNDDVSSIELISESNLPDWAMQR